MIRLARLAPPQASSGSHCSGDFFGVRARAIDLHRGQARAFVPHRACSRLDRSALRQTYGLSSEASGVGQRRANPARRKNGFDGLPSEARGYAATRESEPAGASHVDES